MKTVVREALLLKHVKRQMLGKRTAVDMCFTRDASWDCAFHASRVTRHGG